MDPNHNFMAIFSGKSRFSFPKTLSHLLSASFFQFRMIVDVPFLEQAQYAAPILWSEKNTQR